MKSSFRPSMLKPFGLATIAISLAAAGYGPSARAADGFSDSLVGGLAGVADLEPLMAIDTSRSPAPVREVRPATAPRTLARQSVPARDRAATYRSDELFRNSKVALPLLVADLELQTVASDVQPMSGRSVGARPSAAWTRPLVLPAAPASEPTVRATSWTALSR